ncbi:MAG: hypothetical protein IKU41_08365 [Clostridia bacterium]|nr:hypothetical protein [Clostridia bacterium]
MTINGALAETLVSALSTDVGFSDITFVVAYENEIKPTPLNKPIVAISVKGCEIGEKLTETLENGEITVTNKRDMKTTLSADIYLPYSMGGSNGHKIFDRIATYLLFTKKHNISKSVCYNTDYDSNCEAIILRTHFVFNNTVSA